MRSTLAVVATAAIAGVASGCSTPGNYKVTFYGYPDNSPPGADIAYNCGRGNKAGGIGTYNDPITLATAPGELNKCEIVYLPFLTKYARFEDTCEQCTTDWHNGQPHIDIWTGSNTRDGGQAQIDCEDNLTPGGTYHIVRDPPHNYGVNTAPLFSPPNTCNTGNVYPNNPAHC